MGAGNVVQMEVEEEVQQVGIASGLDSLHEDEVKRNPYSVKLWGAYLDGKKNSVPIVRFAIFKRSLKHLPLSYKLWRTYLQERVRHARSFQPGSPEVEEVGEAFEQALVCLGRCPRLWMDFASFLRNQRLVTRTRRTFDRALRALPITQHHRIWEAYIMFVKDCDLPEMAVEVWRRYLMLEPQHAEAYVAYLLAARKIDEAVLLLSRLVNDDSFESMEGKTNHQLWMELCDLITTYPKKIKSVEVEMIVRAGIRRFTDVVGKLWVSLASYHSRLGHLSRARDVYEEALTSVSTLRDFTVVFEAFAAFEENLIAELLSHPKMSGGGELDVDLHLARLEDLMQRRADLVSQVKLRQNPHNCHEWLNRVKLFEGDDSKVVSTFSEAVMSVDPHKAVGRLYLLWIRFAEFYETNDDVDNARIILEKATKVHFRTVDDLASIWCERAELELRHGCCNEALRLSRVAVHKPRKKAGIPEDAPQMRLWRSVKLWSLLADLEENFGTLDTIKAAYEQMFDLRVITPMQAINFAHYLEENKYWEEAFRVYEKGVATFHWPQLNDIWFMYLSKFTSRFRGSKLERTRELFEQAVTSVPPEFARRLFVFYAQFEMEFGLIRHALDVLARGVEKVPDKEKWTIYKMLITKTATSFGIARTRPIFDVAMEKLPNEYVKEAGVEYAAIEAGLGEVARARAIYQHCSQLADPQKEPQFWSLWRDFEVAQGTEDTFRDMLRTKRAVQALFVQENPISVALDAAQEASGISGDPMAAMEEDTNEKT